MEFFIDDSKFDIIQSEIDVVVWAALTIRHLIIDIII